MLCYQGYEPLEELGILSRLRECGRDVAPRADGTPTGIAVDVGIVKAALADGVPVAHREAVVDLLRDGDRVVGVVTEGPGGTSRVAADLVVACDGRASAVRRMAGLEARFHPLNDAYLSFLSPVAPRALFGFRYLSDGGMVTMLGWPQGSSGSRRIDPIGEDAAKAPSIEAFRRNFSDLMRWPRRSRATRTPTRPAGATSPGASRRCARSRRWTPLGSGSARSATRRIDRSPRPGRRSPKNARRGSSLRDR